jgi:GT2 family glycosyltransferase
MISVILPAARLQEQAQQVVDRLWENHHVHEVVVASPNFEVNNAKCVHDDRLGSSRVLSFAYGATDPSTTYVAWLADICFPQPNALDSMVGFLDERTADPFIAEFRTHPPVTEGHYRVCTITGKQYARWGMLSRKTIEQIGGFFDEAFVAHYGDVDLSLRCWRAGGVVATATDAVIEMHGHWHVSTAPNSADEALFLERWKYDYPAIVTEHTSQWNVDKEIPL